MKSLLAFTTLLLATNTLSATEHQVDPSHVFVWFKVNHLGTADTLGQFRLVEGNFDLEAGKLEFKIKSDSLDTNDSKRDEHLKGPDFFNVKQFPVISFKSNSVKELGKDTYEVTGTLQLHGREKEITVAIQYTGGGKDPWGNTRQGIASTFSINRTDFGMNYMPDLIGNDVQIQFIAEGIQKK